MSPRRSGDRERRLSGSSGSPKCRPLSKKYFSGHCASSCNAEGEKKEAILSPLGLVQQDGRLYLVCQFDGYGNYRHLALHRIDSVKQLKDNALGVSDFKVKDYIKSRHFNYTGDKTRLIHLILDFKNPQTKTYLEESPFNRSQKITEPEKGLFRLETDLVDSILLDGWIKMWEQEAQIVRVEKLKL